MAKPGSDRDGAMVDKQAGKKVWDNWRGFTFFILFHNEWKVPCQWSPVTSPQTYTSFRSIVLIIIWLPIKHKSHFTSAIISQDSVSTTRLTVVHSWHFAPQRSKTYHAAVFFPQFFFLPEMYFPAPTKLDGTNGLCLQMRVLQLDVKDCFTSNCTALSYRTIILMTFLLRNVLCFVIIYFIFLIESNHQKFEGRL